MSVTINFSITSPDVGNAWSGTILVSDDSVKVKNETSALIKSASEDVSFTSTQTASYFSPNYITFRENSIVGQFPTTGRSMDLWSSNLSIDVDTNEITWAGLVGQSYSLSSDKHSLIYSYDEPFAPYWSKGGTISFS